MLELKKITKIYKTEGYTQKALNGVSINFRKNEFASILGPSGSGKTTLLNIIGGLDTYDSGDLIINEISTKNYKDRNWDSYRNHRVGFVFQSYNLISHQSVLANVELALTLSGVRSKERKKRAKEALKKVGLIKHIHKKPSELSGGQMQRVAIARALVNDPDILLADEPTGALDSDTSVQIMDIIKDIAKDKLVIMVTHNPELASLYSTRIIKLKDGEIIDDSNPYDGALNTINEEEIEKKKSKKTQMSLLTALSLSLNNLMTKKGRTILTAFAGSIGIIGIALILSLSSGVNNYISNVQKNTMLSYPITIEKQSINFTGFIADNNIEEEENNHDNSKVYADNTSLKRANMMYSNVANNNLKKFKEYLDNKDSEINKYVGESGIVYKYDTKFSVYTYDSDGTLINTDGSSFLNGSQMKAIDSMGSMPTTMNYTSSNDEFDMIMAGSEGEVSKAILDNYDLLAGNYPKNFDEVVLVTDKKGEVSTVSLYNLGFLPAKDYNNILASMKKGEEVKLNALELNFDDILNKKFKLLCATDFYVKNKNNMYEDVSDNDALVNELVKNGLELKVVGIIKRKDNSDVSLLEGTIGYGNKLNDWIINHTNESEVIKEQLEHKDINVLNGLKFTVNSEEEKINEVMNYLKRLDNHDKALMATRIFEASGQMNASVMQMSETQLVNALDMYLQNASNNVMLTIYDNYLSTGSYEENMELLGKVDMDDPAVIDIYADSFEDKDSITKAISSYNDGVKEEDKIEYTDYVGLLMSSVTSIVNVISYVLIAFVSISLVVSSIMIAIITYISVLERTKEIGVLRAIGASKKDVTRVFKAETFIEGLTSGIIGILVTLLLNIPINIIIKNITNILGIAKLPIMGAIVLIFISTILTVVAGLIPSRMAAKKEAVIALRSE